MKCLLVCDINIRRTGLRSRGAGERSRREFSISVIGPKAIPWADKGMFESCNCGLSCEVRSQGALTDALSYKLQGLITDSTGCDGKSLANDSQWGPSVE